MKFADKLARVRMPPGARAPEAALRDGLAQESSGGESSARIEYDAPARQDDELEGGLGGALHGVARAPRAAEIAEPVELTRLSTIRSLRSRLEAMAKPAPAPGSTHRDGALARSHAPSTPALAAKPSAFDRGPPPRVPAPRDSVVPGERVETPLGPLYRVVVTHDEDHRHGSAEVALACRVCPHEVALLALEPQLASIDYAGALYIDTETTGLSGGTGTLPFLIGMAWFEGERLVVEQLLLQRPGQEGPMLTRLAERIAEASVIVSYNGKSFDWPLLRTRFILNRIVAPPLPAHLDLLHCARRVYKSRLGSVRLIYMEQALMGFERVDDIPGELIPETYLSFLRGSTPGAALVPIVDHNRSDLIALPALLGEIVRRFVGEQPRQDARDQLSFARVAARGEASARAIAFAEAAVEADVRGELTATALFLVGELKQQQDDWAGACVAFEASLTASLSAFDRARAQHALAKLCEHKLKDHERALGWARQTAAFEGEQACERRVARLTARLEKRALARARPEKRERNSAIP